MDLDLQQYAEHLLSNKRAGLVAIEPKTGEFWPWYTTPNYDPNQLTITNNARGDVYKKLATDPNIPLFNRAVMAHIRLVLSIKRFWHSLASKLGFGVWIGA